ncbi:hypothetical protein T265_10200 [Opisthorchis viverrini]|uniref:Uncharacterized protein n=1 Tax=Opisthorchis viverrini TaxID=6198 RepID=A0A074Z7D0_OPIVI|nr:hypothetical protein T265_10200 [Opisthorchis viverrini]KER21487.1 hypothetical protein T265_10200 [Opisthorchis viverrini]
MWDPSKAPPAFFPSKQSLEFYPTQASELECDPNEVPMQMLRKTPNYGDSGACRIRLIHPTCSPNSSIKPDIFRSLPEFHPSKVVRISFRTLSEVLRMPRTSHSHRNRSSAKGYQCQTV